ncbi:MAG: hypothetical protein DWQ56_17455 [Microcystis aeruginosa DA14]|uniref:Uncharacterized protein n=1 Tax=Microcystis aeruginosa DA14 TaxID=1987506 RepID=A0A3E0M4T7_MICAE|nr:MAG: hypothetical protein DWQ56_17455 [Microcystis aeruginosa DA14]
MLIFVQHWVRRQLSVISYQLSVIRCEFLVYCLLKKLPTPHTLHPSPFSLLPNPHFPSKLLYRDSLGKYG